MSTCLVGNGKTKKIVEVPMSATTKEKTIKRAKVRNSVKIWGVCISPSLSWNDKFEHAKENIIFFIKKLMKTGMGLCQVFLVLMI